MSGNKNNNKKRIGPGKRALCAVFAAAALSTMAGDAGINAMPQMAFHADKTPAVSLLKADVIEAFGQSAMKKPRAEDPALGHWNFMRRNQEELMKDPAKAKAFSDYLARFDHLKKYDLELQAFFVNFTVLMDITYTKDNVQYHTDDYWAAPVETVLSRKGDCEDIALLQKAVLRYLGVPENRMFIAHVNTNNDLSLGPNHAILLLNEAPVGEPPSFFILNDVRPLIPADNAAVKQGWMKDGVAFVDARNEEGFWTIGLKYTMSDVPSAAAESNVKIAAARPGPGRG